MRVFLDANVLFSAARSDGAIRRLLDLLLRDGHECWADGYVVEEARRNLAAKAADRLSVFEGILRRIRVADVQPAPQADPAGEINLPDKDRPVLAAAARVGCTALVTGDRTHFGAFFGKALGGVEIHSPRSLAETLWGGR
jgi:predicted nucleic acid-binding protein